MCDVFRDMETPFNQKYWEWHMSLVMSGWSVLAVAVPPPGKDDPTFLSGPVSKMAANLDTVISPTSGVVEVNPPVREPNIPKVGFVIVIFCFHANLPRVGSGRVLVIFYWRQQMVLR